MYDGWYKFSSFSRQGIIIMTNTILIEWVDWEMKDSDNMLFGNKQILICSNKIRQPMNDNIE